MAKRVTLDDVARATQLSKYAVSRAIAGKSGISEPTREKILKACADLGYVRQPKKEDGSYILLMVPKLELDDASSWMRIAQGVELAAEAAGYQLRIQMYEETASATVRSLAEKAAGAIYLSHRAVGFIEEFHKMCPTLMCTNVIRPLMPVDNLNLTDFEAADALCDYLIGLGHEKIAYFGPVNRLYGKEIIRGINSALDRHGLTIHALWKDNDDCNSHANTKELLTQCKESGTMPTAIMCSGGNLAQTVTYLLNSMQIAVPDMVSVTSFNSDTTTQTSLPFTTVAFDKQKYGMEAFHLLHKRILNPDTAWVRMRLTQELVIGATTGPRNP